MGVEEKDELMGKTRKTRFRVSQLTQSPMWTAVAHCALPFRAAGPKFGGKSPSMDPLPSYVLHIFGCRE